MIAKLLQALKFILIRRNFEYLHQFWQMINLNYGIFDLSCFSSCTFFFLFQRYGVTQTRPKIFLTTCFKEYELYLGNFQISFPPPLPHTFPSGPYFVVMKKYYWCTCTVLYMCAGVVWCFKIHWETDFVCENCDNSATCQWLCKYYNVAHTCFFISTCFIQENKSYKEF